jgi:hypothetical protein
LISFDYQAYPVAIISYVSAPFAYNSQAYEKRGPSIKPLNRSTLLGNGAKCSRNEAENAMILLREKNRILPREEEIEKFFSKNSKINTANTKCNCLV